MQAHDFSLDYSFPTKVKSPHLKVETFYNMLVIFLSLSFTMSPVLIHCFPCFHSCCSFFLECPLSGFYLSKSPFYQFYFIHQQAYEASYLLHTHPGVILRTFNHCFIKGTILSEQTLALTLCRWIGGSLWVSRR